MFSELLNLSINYQTQVEDPEDPLAELESSEWPRSFVMFVGLESCDALNCRLG